MFKVGQNAVHASHGVGVVRSIERREFDGVTREFYVFEVHDNGAPKKIFVPVDSASARLRAIVKRSDAQRILKQIRAGQGKPLSINTYTWNAAYRTYMQAMQSGDIETIARVWVDFAHIAATRDLSFGERCLREQARTLLEAELSLALGQPVDLSVVTITSVG